MMAALVLPDIPADENVDLRDHYFRERQAFFGAGAAVVAWSIAREVIVEGQLPEPTNLAFHLIFLAMSVTALFSVREFLHKIFAAAMAGIFAVYTAMLFAQLD